MAKVVSLRGEARRRRLALTGERERIREETRRHIQECYICRKAGDSPYNRCDTGWQLAKDETRNRNQLRKFDTAETGQQESLWESS